MIFTCSMSDLFHPRVPWDYIVKVFDVMAAADWHTFQVLTKRPGRMAHFAEHIWPKQGGRWAPMLPLVPDATRWPGTAWPENVWAGTSVENQKYAARLDVLARVPAKVRFVSAEPLLGPLDLWPWLTGHPFEMDPAKGYDGRWDEFPDYACFPAINWVIVGGESGAHYRVMKQHWAIDLRDQCLSANVPFFFKQDSGLRPGQNRELDGRTWDEMPTQ